MSFTVQAGSGGTVLISKEVSLMLARQFMTMSPASVNIPILPEKVIAARLGPYPSLAFVCSCTLSQKLA